MLHGSYASAPARAGREMSDVEVQILMALARRRVACDEFISVFVAGVSSEVIDRTLQALDAAGLVEAKAVSANPRTRWLARGLTVHGQHRLALLRGQFRR